MNVHDVMRPLQNIIDSHETVRAAAVLMKDDDVGCLMVGNETHLEGIVTDRDIAIRCVLESKDSLTTTVGDVMSVGVVCCHEDEPIEDVISRMISLGVLRLPVLDSSEHVIGIVSARDCVRDVPMSKMSQRKARKVTFTKDLVSSRGELHQVPVQSVYVSGAMKKAEAEDAAIEQFESDRGVADWSEVANGIKTEDPS